MELVLAGLATTAGGAWVALVLVGALLLGGSIALLFFGIFYATSRLGHRAERAFTDDAFLKPVRSRETAVRPQHH